MKRSRMNTKRPQNLLQSSEYYLFLNLYILKYWIKNYMKTKSTVVVIGDSYSKIQE